jgi:hypothetical protein
MSDLLERLREPLNAGMFLRVGDLVDRLNALRAEAADRIEFLENKLNRMIDAEIEANLSAGGFSKHLLTQPVDPAPETVWHEMERWLVLHGFFVGDRDPRANTEHLGRFMVIDTDTLSLMEETNLTFPDASHLNGGWCLVGDDRNELVWQTYSFHHNDD